MTFISPGTSGKFLSLPEPQFPHLENGKRSFGRPFCIWSLVALHRVLHCMLQPLVTAGGRHTQPGPGTTALPPTPYPCPPTPYPCPPFLLQVPPALVLPHDMTSGCPRQSQSAPSSSIQCSKGQGFLCPPSGPTAGSIIMNGKGPFRATGS